MEARTGKPDALDRLAQALAAIAALLALASGLSMLVRPLGWYGLVPTAPGEDFTVDQFLAERKAE